VFLFLPPGGYLVPVGWLFGGGLAIVIVTSLKTATQQLVEANERHRVLFRELQHRVANTLQSVVGRLETVRLRLDEDPSGAKEIMDEAVRRFTASADVHRRLSDPSLFERGLEPILTDAVESVIDTETTNVSFDLSPLRLSLDQMSIITMLVIEAANNAQKHVFGHNRGTHFLVSLRAFSHNRAVLIILDDGPAWVTKNASSTEMTLGLTVIEGLAKQLGGTLDMKTQKGTEINVIFPLPPT
jgi:two-component sensor histidine kinase